MGKLKIETIVKVWVLPLVVAVAAFLVVRPGMVEALTREEIHGLFLATQKVEVEAVGGEREKRRIEYRLGDERRVVSQEGMIVGSPDVEGEYVVWMGLVGTNWQIFRYSLMTEETVQLSGVGNNVNPDVYGDRVVWEGFVNGAWQVFMFDGVSVTQLTYGQAIQDADLFEEWLVYSQKSNDGTASEILVRNLVTGGVIDLGEGSRPRFAEGVVVWEIEIGGVAVEQRISLVVEAPEVEPTVVIEEEASQSAVPVASESAEQVVPVATESGTPEASESGEAL